MKKRFILEVGDKVRIKSIDWYNENKNNRGHINLIDGSTFSPGMSKFCGEVCTIKHLYKIHDNGVFYSVEENNYNWTDEMIEGLAEEEETNQNIINSVLFQSNLKYTKVSINTENCSDEVEINISDDYELVEKEGKWFAVKKKPKYPQTYEECCDVLGIEEDLWFVYEDIDGNHINPACISNYRMRRLDLYHNLEKLLFCRDAYWKIAGEEMGLGEPWKADYDSGINKFGIICMNGVIQKSNPTTNWERHLNKVLEFPTEEMRDAFYENFKELINEVKELL